ncbi:MAG: T9SS type A sorting domain-containing protein, partial [Flavobacteriales bacterium]|nr:T9SS type A sorting domain-containing protein [Flavobacteriales bacterium]
DMTFTQELVSSVGVDEFSGSASDLNIYPNPSSDGTVQLLMNWTPKNSVLTIVDASGRVVAQHLLPSAAGPVVRTIDLNGIPAGIYHIRVQGEGVGSSAKLLVQ